MKVWCNCGITQLYVKCGEWITANDELKLKMACCQDQCPKLMSCGHRYEKPLKIHIKFFREIKHIWGLLTTLKKNPLKMYFEFSRNFREMANHKNHNPD